MGEHRSSIAGTRDPVAENRDQNARVKVAQDQARRSLRLAVGFTVAAALGAVVPHHTGTWLPLHLFLVGALLLAISGATQFFTLTWGASLPVAPSAVVAQRWLVVVGAAGLAAGRELDAPPALLIAAGLCVTSGLLLLGVLLAVEDRRARVDRFHPAVHAYLTAVAAGLVGTALGAALVTGAARIRDAHVILNLFGLVGLVVAGTLPYFVATQARMKMSSRATPRTQRGNLVWLAASVVTASVGALSSHPGVVGLGLAGYAVGILRVAASLPRPGTKQLRWAGPRLPQLALGLGWWVGSVSVAAIRAAQGQPPLPEPLLAALVIGGYGQILLASLAYLGPVLRGGGHVSLSEGFTVTRSWASVVLVNLAGIAAAADRLDVTAILLTAVAVDVVVRAARLAGQGRHRARDHVLTSVDVSVE